MNFKILPAVVGLALSLLMSAPAQEANGKRQQAPKKELTREEIAKLGGFEPNPEEPVIPAIVQMELVIVAVPKADTLRLSGEFKNPTTTEQAYREVLGLIKTKKAKLIGAPSMEAKPGRRCCLEICTEVRYAIEFEPLQGGKAVVAGKADPVKALPLEAPAAIGVVPTAFETRNTGVTLEAEPLLGPDGRTIDIEFTAQHVQLLGWDTSSVEEKGELVQRIPQPRFHSNKVSTRITLRAGQRVLAGVFGSATDPEVMEMFLLRVSTRDAKRK
jgi:hypothetical protein